MNAVTDFDLIERVAFGPTFSSVDVAALTLQDDGAGSVVDRFDLRRRVTVVGNDDAPGRGSGAAVVPVCAIARDTGVTRSKEYA